MKWGMFPMSNSKRYKEERNVVFETWFDGSRRVGAGGNASELCCAQSGARSRGHRGTGDEHIGDSRDDPRR
jgi:hypothetical protein